MIKCFCPVITDHAIINLGPYEPRWFMGSSHMNPRQAVQVFEELNKVAINEPE